MRIVDQREDSSIIKVRGRPNKRLRDTIIKDLALNTENFPFSRSQWCHIVN